MEIKLTESLVRKYQEAADAGEREAIRRLAREWMAENGKDRVPLDEYRAIVERVMGMEV